mmetsp:Transcript_39/g.106  ORF Transcript_39/g.106 Transcript_39/m.106 type:complete len:157 (-) Transcript_39:170-640(-)|eukprot:CAMPEP_0197423102 /NCGR_PEP_ID=MMETSP1170-20131217/19502_1 /TAXON_ID=54406 /ORGANISM="Sarcinochrysis sp, Strain CCMP770" /LENGTH=156 /DNA_ID=CAMNT_0042950493 /DNA_START=29 /DNA_END=499 /DNA_ORIENTATION=+
MDDESSSSDDEKPGRASGRWSRAEHEEFLRCLAIYGREWKKVSQRITTRTAAQIRSHAQKYFKKINQDKNEDHEHRAIAAPRLPTKLDHRRRPTAEQALAEVDDALGHLRAKRKHLLELQDPPRGRRRIVSHDDLHLADSELIALEMLCSRRCVNA